MEKLSLGPPKGNDFCGIRPGTETANFKISFVYVLCVAVRKADLVVD